MSSIGLWTYQSILVGADGEDVLVGRVVSLVSVITPVEEHLAHGRVQGHGGQRTQHDRQMVPLCQSTHTTEAGCRAAILVVVVVVMVVLSSVYGACCMLYSLCEGRHTHTHAHTQTHVSKHKPKWQMFTTRVYKLSHSQFVKFTLKAPQIHCGGVRC